MRIISNTLIEIIQLYVKPDLIIITDGWRGHYNIKTHGFVHLSVSHSSCFKESGSGANTNKIEGLQNGIKNLIKSRNHTKDISTYLDLFVWRRIHKHQLCDEF